MDKQNRFYLARRQIGLKQYQVAELLNLGKGAVSKWECGRSIPDQSVLPKLADLYKVSIDYLLGREEKFDGLNVINQPLETEVQSVYDNLTPRQQQLALAYMYGFADANAESAENKLNVLSKSVERENFYGRKEN